MVISTFLEGINKKSDKAWEELYRHYYASLCSYSDKILGDSGLAEDTVQDCLIKMWHASVNFTETRALTAWLYKSVYNASISVLRERKSLENFRKNWGDEQLNGDDHAIDMALREEVITCFHELLNQMSEQQRNVLIYSLKGLSVQQIAELTQISENSVKTHKKRAYIFVRERFDPALLPLLLSFFFSPKQ